MVCGDFHQPYLFIQVSGGDASVTFYVFFFSFFPFFWVSLLCLFWVLASTRGTGLTWGARKFWRELEKFGWFLLKEIRFKNMPIFIQKNMLHIRQIIRVCSCLGSIHNFWQNSVKFLCIILLSKIFMNHLLWVFFPFSLVSHTTGLHEAIGIANKTIFGQFCTFLCKLVPKKILHAKFHFWP